MKTFLIFSSIIDAALILAAIMTAGCESDYPANYPHKNAPAYQPNYPMLTNNPPAPLAPTGPTPQHYLTEDTNR
jgi:hypothetical protein